MKEDNQVYFQEQNSWFDCIGDFTQQNNQRIQKRLAKNKTKTNNQQYHSVYVPQNMTLSKSQDQPEASHPQKFKRTRAQTPIDEQQFTQNSSSNQLKPVTSNSRDDTQRQSRKSKQEKQHIYSKNYRQRKKQQVKLLQQENEYLKKKVQQLQFRLREMQLEMNRIKFMPEQKEFTIDQLNQQFMSKVTVIMEKNKQNPLEYRNNYEPVDDFYWEFMETYSKHGFGGSKKIEIMNYYFNEILEAMLRDSERYFSLLCTQAKDGNHIKGVPEYQLINNAFWQILQPDQDKLKRLSYFQLNLHPMFLDLVQSTRQLNYRFKKVLKSIDKIHQFMKTNYPSNFDFARKRIIELQSWFQKHKYSKMIRNLRGQWLELIKSQQHLDYDIKNLSGIKKKKTAYQAE